MLKRWPNIFLAAWLINALLCFHPVFARSAARQAIDCFGRGYYGNEKATAFVNVCYHHRIQEKPDKSGQGQHKHHRKLPGKYHYLLSRTGGPDMLNMQHMQALLPDWPYLAKSTLPVYRECKFMLPPHYHYLFLLSPF